MHDHAWSWVIVHDHAAAASTEGDENSTSDVRLIPHREGSNASHARPRRLYVAICAAYGWCIQEKVNISAPLILLIGVGFLSMAVMNATQTLILDLVPEQGSSVTACLIIDAIGVGWTYVLLAGFCRRVAADVGGDAYWAAEAAHGGDGEGSAG
ncbi:hypothetical protein C8F01DRAFT_1284020 [Mycena amicta]|nr:hypothetical protein C8F01DRAFT_1284020 [Mycena amicta]